MAILPLFLTGSTAISVIYTRIHNKSRVNSFPSPFFIQLFSLASQRITRGRLEPPRHAPFVAPRPAFRPVPRPCGKAAPQGPRNAKRRQDFSCRQSVVGLPFREAVKPPLFVPVLRDRLLGELCDGQPIGFDPREDRLDDVRGKAVQGKDAGDVAGFQAELL